MAFNTVIAKKQNASVCNNPSILASRRLEMILYNEFEEAGESFEDEDDGQVYEKETLDINLIHTYYEESEFLQRAFARPLRQLCFVHEPEAKRKDDAQPCLCSSKNAVQQDGVLFVVVRGGT
ncbi:MAG: hypothetical protein IJJ32_01895 [Eggerthellaceae bacterium]|nr:hypothetical protein [Eggerthellaceae bacterium]